MSLTSLIHRGKKDRPFRAVIYGGDGVGKSSWAAQAPKPLFLDIEDGIGEIDVDSINLSEAKFEDVIETIRVLLSEDHGYKTIVIDSIDWFERKIWNKVVRDYEKPIQSIEDIGYAKGYTLALGPLSKFLVGLDKLRKEKGMNVIMIAHGTIVRVEDPMFDSYDKWCLKLHKKARAIIQEWADVIMFATYDTTTRRIGDSFGQEKYKAIGDGKRVLYTSEKPSFEAKTRFKIPEKLPLDFGVFQKALNEGRK